MHACDWRFIFFMFRLVHDANANGTGLSRQDDMKHFHGTYKEVCDKHDPDYYAKFKKVSQSASQPVSHPVTIQMQRRMLR